MSHTCIDMFHFQQIIVCKILIKNVREIKNFKNYKNVKKFKKFENCKKFKKIEKI